MKLFIIILKILLITYCFCQSQDEGDQIKKLRNELLVKRNYDRMSRPVKHHETPTYVQFSLTVIEFVDLDLNEHILTTEAYSSLDWTDEHLTWNPKDFGGLTEIRFGGEELWKPDISVLNSFESINLEKENSQSDMLVNYNGSVLWVPQSTFRTKCPLNLINYPFDEQFCAVKFGSWVHTSDQINITFPDDESSVRGPWLINPEWDLIEKNFIRTEIDFPDFGTYVTLTLEVKFRRNSSFHFYTILIPSFSAMILTLSIFWMPLHSNIRLVFNLISLIISFILLLYLGLQLGISSFGIPNPIKNLSCLVLLNGVTLIFSIFSYQLYLICINSKLNAPLFLMNCLKGTVGYIFCLSDTFITKIKNDRVQLTSEEEQPTSNEINPNENDWMIIFTFVDRLIFFIYSIILIIKLI